MKKIFALFVALVFVASFAMAAVNPDWDKSSLSFTTTDMGCGVVKATVCNVGSDMLGSVNYALYYAESGNPKDGSVIDIGVLGPLLADECTDLMYSSNDLASGNYMFWAEQRMGHPGKGELWSDDIAYTEDVCNEVPEFGVIAGVVALIGALGIFLFRRNN